MPYDRKSLGVLVHGTGGYAQWRYKSSVDSMATIVADGYFDDQHQMLSVGQTIFVQAADATEADRNATLAVIETTPTVRVVKTGAAGAGGAALSDADPEPLGTAAPGVGTAAARDDHVHDLPAVATTTAPGLLSATDKVKLNTVVPDSEYRTVASPASGASVNVTTSAGAQMTYGAWAHGSVNLKGNVGPIRIHIWTSGATDAATYWGVQFSLDGVTWYWPTNSVDAATIANSSGSVIAASSATGVIGASLEITPAAEFTAAAQVFTRVVVIDTVAYAARTISRFLIQAKNALSLGGASIVRIPGAVSGALSANAEVSRQLVEAPVLFAAGGVQHIARVTTSPSTGVTLTIRKNGVDIGTILFNSGETTGTFTLGETTFARGDFITIHTDSTVGSIAGLYYVLVGTLI